MKGIYYGIVDVQMASIPGLPVSFVDHVRVDSDIEAVQSTLEHLQDLAESNNLITCETPVYTQQVYIIATREFFQDKLLIDNPFRQQPMMDVVVDTENHAILVTRRGLADYIYKWLQLGETYRCGDAGDLHKGQKLYVYSPDNDVVYNDITVAETHQAVRHHLLVSGLGISAYSHFYPAQHRPGALASWTDTKRSLDQLADKLSLVELRRLQNQHRRVHIDQILMEYPPVEDETVEEPEADNEMGGDGQTGHDQFANIIIPHYLDSGENADMFVDTTLVAPSYRKISNVDVKTAPLKAGQTVDLLGISNHSDLLEAGVIDYTDAIEPHLILQKIYIQLAQGGSVVSFDVSQYPDSGFTMPIEGENHEMVLNFHTEDLVLKPTTLDVNDSVPSELQTIRDNNYMVHLRVTVGGHAHLTRGNVTVEAAIVEVVVITTEDGDVVPMATEAGKAIEDALGGMQMIGYELLAARAKSD